MNKPTRRALLSTFGKIPMLAMILPIPALRQEDHPDHDLVDLGLLDPDGGCRPNTLLIRDYKRRVLATGVAQPVRELPGGRVGSPCEFKVLRSGYAHELVSISAEGEQLMCIAAADEDDWPWGVLRDLHKGTVLCNTFTI